MKMPFGKYKDHDIEDVNTGYLEWLLEQNIQEDLKYAIREETKQRLDTTKTTKGKQIKLSKNVFMEELAKIIVKTPEEFLHQEYLLETIVGKFQIRIRKVY